LPEVTIAKESKLGTLLCGRFGLRVKTDRSEQEFRRFLAILAVLAITEERQEFRGFKHDAT
jgi:hypothetical protein